VALDRKQRWINWLHRQANKPQQHIRRFSGGGILFSLGLGMILYVEKTMLPSLQQELAAGFGLLLAALGIAIAFWGYVGLSVLRILIYFLPPAKRKRSKR